MIEVDSLLYWLVMADGDKDEELTILPVLFIVTGFACLCKYEACSVRVRYE